MPKPAFPPAPDPDRFTYRIEELRAALRNTDPNLLAVRSGTAFQLLEAGRGQFNLHLWNQPVLLDWPNLTAVNAENGPMLNAMELTLLLFYLATADGAPPTGQWISFSELPEGRFYNPAFQGYTGQSLAQTFKNELPAFIQAANAAGGMPQPLGDAAFAFQALPRVPLLAVYWQGDEDFPASAQILLDASASHYLPTEAYAILGSALTRRVIKARLAG